MRMRQAEEGIRALKESVDSLIVIPNQRLLSLVDKNTPLTAAFQLADSVLHQATRGISDVINVPGLINVDFADVKTIMSMVGDALMGMGTGSGEDRALVAAQQAISSPLLEEVSIAGAKGVLVNVTGGSDLSLTEVSEALNVVHETAGPDAHIIFGAVLSEELKDEVQVTVLATGIKSAQTESDSAGIQSIEVRPRFERAARPAARVEARAGRAEAPRLPVDPEPAPPVRRTTPEREEPEPAPAGPRPFMREVSRRRAPEPVRKAAPEPMPEEEEEPALETHSLREATASEEPVDLNWPPEEIEEVEVKKPAPTTNGGRNRVSLWNADDLDTPTFLRKQMD
jgi:cell division protein FtsZ